jgi:hypothetical protein
MLLVVALIALLVAVPVAINVMAVGQAPTSEEAALVVQARQAADAGISDYINRVETTAGYTQYCSTGMTKWTCLGSTTPAPTATNPAFVNSAALAGQWYTGGLTMRGVANGTPSYRYVVNSPNTANPALVTIYSIGQAGTQSGLHVSSTEEAALSVCGAGCLTPVPAASCIKVPTGAVSAKIVAYGAAGAGGGTDAAAGVGALVTATVPVTAGHTLYLIPGQPGIPGNPGLISSLLGLLSIFPGAGGAGGSALAGGCSLSHPNAPPDLSGGNGALPGVGAPPLYTGALVSGGGGGGGATAVYDSTAGSMVVAAGGGGGGGAGNLLSLLGLDPPGAGGKGGSPPTAGANTPGILLLLGGSPGGLGGSWTAGGATTCASGSAGNACGQNGYTPPVLAGVATGGAGGGGGGFQAAGLGGGGGGTTGGILGILGSGAGGGAGTSYATPGCSSSTVPVATYPAGDTTQSGQVAYSFYSGVAGSCASTAITTVTGTIRPAAPPS